MKTSSGRYPRYPLGTIMFYGPDNTRATKLVAAVFKRPQQREADALHRWFVDDGDIRRDPGVIAEVSAFFKKHGAKQTVMSDGITGCPHEEGVDYPMGRACPHCPFWVGIDRFTHQPIVVPTPTRSVEEILADLATESGEQPLAALESADAHRAALVDPLLRAIERGLETPTELPQSEATLFCYAAYLLAKWRETRAFPLIIRWLSLPGRNSFAIGGDTVTQDGARILASTFGGDFEPVKSLILNREANEYCRGQALDAMALLAAWGEVPHDTVESYFLWLAREGLERDHSHVWDELASSALDIEALPVFPELRRAYDEGLINPGFVAPAELDKVEAGPRGKWIELYRESNPPISDVVEATSWWSHTVSAPDVGEVSDFADPEPVRSQKTGRNAPCPCGSGKKYKKCCGA